MSKNIPVDRLVELLSEVGPYVTYDPHVADGWGKVHNWRITEKPFNEWTIGVKMATFIWIDGIPMTEEDVKPMLNIGRDVYEKSIDMSRDRGESNVENYGFLSSYGMIRRRLEEAA